MRMLAVSLAAACTILAPAAARLTPPAPAGGAPEGTIPAPVKKAADALAEVDLDRLGRDAVYAGEILGHVDVLLPSVRQEPGLSHLRNIRLMTLLALGRQEEAKSMAAAIIAQKPRLAFSYAGPMMVAGAARDWRRLLAALETASVSVTDPGQVSAFNRGLPDEAVRDIAEAIATANDQQARYRLAEALLTLGWPGPEDPSRVDYNRVTSIDGRLQRRDRAGAAALARQVVSPQPLLELLALRRYDPLFGPGLDRAARIAEAVSREDAHTSRLVESRPGDLASAAIRATHLRTAGREADAVALLWPIVSNMAKVEQAGEPAFWLVNEAAYGLIATGRAPEALLLMKKLLALDMEKHPYLINMAINYGSAMLPAMGRHAEAVDWAMKLEAQGARYATPYGRMWIWSSLACNLAAQDKPLEAAAWLEKLKAGSAGNQAAHMRGLLCLNRMDEAERLLLARLAEPDPARTVLAMQDFTATPAEPDYERKLGARWAELIARPAVVQALDRVGRRLSVPLSRSYWGAY